MAITIKDAIEALDLKGFEEIVNQSKGYGIYPRRSGRTTLMLLEAVIASQEEEVVYISARTYDYAKHLTSQARGMCIRLGLDPEKIKPISHKTILGRVYNDHGQDFY